MEIGKRERYSLGVFIMLLLEVLLNSSEIALEEAGVT